MIQPAFEILNQRGTPMFFSDVFANRPTAGVVGRIFISTDTYAFYRDTGTGWDLIGGPGTGTITGSGTANKITKFTGTTSIGDSIMTEGTGLITLTGSNSRFVVGGTDDGSSQLQTYYDGNTRWKFVAASDTPTDDADITGYKSRGTIAFPTAIQSGDSITNYSGRGHNGTTFVGGGGFDIFAAENYSVGNNGSYIAVETTPIGSASPTYFHRFSANGGLNVGQNADPTTGYVFQASGNSIVQSGKLVINNASSDSHLQVVGANAPSIRIDNAIVGATQRFVMGLATATNNFIQGSTAGDICISTASASPLLFGMWQTINASEVMRISTANNLIIGSITDNGNRLQVTGNGYFSGHINFPNSGEHYIQNSASTTFIGLNFDIPRIRFALNNIVRATLDASGNLGLGVVPSAWSSGKAMQFTAGSIWALSTSDMNYLANANYDGSFKYVNSTGALRYFQDASTSSHAWYTAPSGTAGNAISFTQAMTLTDTGRLGIGTSTPARIFTIFGGALTSRIILQNTATGQAINNGLDITMDGTDAQVWNYQTGSLQFATSNNERARFSSSGNLLIGMTTDQGQKLQINGNQYTTGIVFSDTGFQISSGAYNNITEVPYTGIFMTGSSSVDGFGALLVSSRTDVSRPIIFGTSNGTTSVERGRFSNDGNLLIGSSSNPGQKLYLNGSLRIDGQTSGTAGGNSGQHLIINCDGTTYKIALLNP